MKVIYAGLFTVFLLMSIFLTASVFGLINSSKYEISNNSLNPICLKSKLSLENINYNEEVLSFELTLESDASDILLEGLNLRDSSSESVMEFAFEDNLKSGQTIIISQEIKLTDDKEFLISPLSCSSSYEKLCHVKKGFC